MMSSNVKGTYLLSNKYVDFDNPLVAEKAFTLADGETDTLIIARRCFEFVRDEIHHSWDYRQNPVTCKASDVLRHATGFCYAKSHLLAALLRANGIPAGLCYQRISLGDAGPPYCLHGLNAVFLKDYGWYRVDARGNKPDVDAQFCPPREALAFAIRESHERDLPEKWAEPLPVVIAALERHRDITTLYDDLPDVPVIG